MTAFADQGRTSRHVISERGKGHETMSTSTDFAHALGIDVVATDLRSATVYGTLAGYEAIHAADTDSNETDLPYSASLDAELAQIPFVPLDENLFPSRADEAAKLASFTTWDEVCEYAESNALTWNYFADYAARIWDTGVGAFGKLEFYSPAELDAGARKLSKRRSQIYSCTVTATFRDFNRDGYQFSVRYAQGKLVADSFKVCPINTFSR